jgi:hypothetical protein
MIHLFILLFFGSALAVGLYCLWVALLVEVNRAPKSMRFNNDRVLRPAIGHASTQTAPHAR